MAEEYCGGINWWESPSTTATTNRSNRFDGVAGGGAASSASSTTAAYGWLTDGSTSIDINAGRSSLETVDASNKMDGSSSLLVGLGLSSQPLDWNQQQLLNAEKSDNSFRSMLQEGMGVNTGPMFCGQQQLAWRDQKLFPSQPNEDSTSEFKQLGHHNQAQFSPSCSSMESTVTCQAGHGFQLENTSSSSSSVYSTNILQGFIAADQQQQQQQQQTQLSYQQQNYFGMVGSTTNNNDQSWPIKVPQFLRATSPKQIQQQQQQQQQQLHFANNAPYWNASNNPVVSMIDVRPSFFSSLQNQLPMQTFEEKPKNILEVRETSTTAKKSATENNNKRGRNEGGSSTLPPFKVRKEKMGDRITALQQLVSPFGKTDTASVLSEAIEYIKFLHEQVSVLSTPYLKSGASYQQQQPNNDKAKMDQDGPKQDLRSRGLCLVPVSSTFPMTHETTVDFWTPTFGGTFR